MELFCNDIKMKLPQVTLLEMTDLFILLFNNISIMQNKYLCAKLDEIFKILDGEDGWENKRQNFVVLG